MGAMQQQTTKLINRFNPYVKNNDSLMIARKKLDDLNKIVENKWNEELNRLPGSFYQTIIRAFNPVKVPELEVPTIIKNQILTNSPVFHWLVLTRMTVFD